MPFVAMTIAMPSATMRDRRRPVDDVDEIAEQPPFDDADGEEMRRYDPIDGKISASASIGHNRRGASRWLGASEAVPEARTSSWRGDHRHDGLRA